VRSNERYFQLDCLNHSVRRVAERDGRVARATHVQTDATERLHNRQRAIELGQADDLRPGHVRSVLLSARREEKSAGRVGDAGFFPFAGENIDGFVRQRMRVRGHRDARFELSQNNDAAARFVLVQDQQFNARIRPRLPGLVLGPGYILKHAFIKEALPKKASRVSRVVPTHCTGVYLGFQDTFVESRTIKEHWKPQMDTNEHRYQADVGKSNFNRRLRSLKVFLSVSIHTASYWNFRRLHRFLGARVCDPQQLPLKPNLRQTQRVLCCPACCGSQSRAPLVAASPRYAHLWFPVFNSRN
jgi:hypothetical protein